MNDKKILIYTDGACSGNPGPGGWGAVIIYGDETKEIFGGEKSTTNNRMELLAAINALKSVCDDSEVVLCTDSQYVKNGITSWISSWTKNNWKNSKKQEVKNKDLWLELIDVSSKRNIEWRWVKGHAGHDFNERADELARIGCCRAQME